MSDRVSFRCVGCQQVVKVPRNYLGRKVRCPKCSKVFRAGEKPQPAAPAATQNVPPQVIPTPIPPNSLTPSTSPRPMAEEVDSHSPLTADPPPADFAVSNPAVPQPMPPGLMAPQPLPPGLSNPAAPPIMPTEVPASEPDLLAPNPAISKPKRQPPKSRREAIERGKQKQKSMSREMDEFSTNLQSSGIFLVTLPLIATVLPLFGLQLRRLSRAGDSAPLAAMFLGLIGAGLIAYARRSKGDGVMIGGAAAVFALLSGVGGYFLISGLSNGEVAADSSYSGSAFGERQVGNPITQHEIAEMERKKHERRAAANKRNAANRFKPPGLSNPGQANQNDANAKVENDGRGGKRLGGIAGNENSAFGNQGNKNPFANDQFANRPGRAGNATGDNRLPKRQPPSRGNPFANDENEPEDENANPFGEPVFVESIPNSFQTRDVRQSAFRRWGKGLLPFAQIRRTKKLDKGRKFGETIGEESRSGRLFAYTDPILGVEVMKLGAGLYIPIESSQSPSEDAIAMEDHQLAGFNLAFSDGVLVGMQGIFAPLKDGKADPTTLKETHWLGLETDDVVQTLAGKKRIFGYVCFTEGNKTVGFALITKR